MILAIGLALIPYMFKRDTLFELKESKLAEQCDEVCSQFSVMESSALWGSKGTISGGDFFGSEGLMQKYAI